MKNKMFYPLFAIAFLGMQALSCAKNTEEEVPEERPTGRLTSIEAYIVQQQDPEATKTDYVLDEVNKVAVFSWVDGDHIDAVVTKGTTVSSVVFTKQADDSEHTNQFLDGQLSGQATLAQRSGYDLGDRAFYPSRFSPEAQAGSFIADWSYEGGKFKLDMPASVTRPNIKPLSMIPMVGKRDSEGKYAFTQPVGVLAISVKNLPLEADFISIHSETAALAGSFELAESGDIQYIAARAATSDVEKTVTQHFSNLQGDHVFYFSVPVGDLPTGLELTVGSSSNEDCRMTKKTLKPITVARGNIVTTPALTFTPVDPQWEAYGTGTFKDDFLWTYNTGFNNPTTVQVNIQWSAKYPKRFRINNPYTVACTDFGYTPYTPNVEADDYFEFAIDTDGTVTYPSFRTGVEDTKENGLPMMLNNGGNCTKVISWQRNGDFYEILFGSLYTLYNPDDDPARKYTKTSETNAPLHLTVNVTETWAKEADGTFIDEKIWSLHGWGTEKVAVELYQSDQIAGHYRVPNPYLVAKDHFNYSTYTSGITGDPYLEFTVEASDAVRFVSFNAGIEDRTTGGFPIRVYYPSDVGTYPTALAGNLVTSYRTDGMPAEVELYPIYVDVNGGAGNYYTDQGTSRARLSFPEAETWKAVSTLKFKDDFYFNTIKGKPVDSNVSVTLEQSSTNPKRFRMANPYPALCDALGVQKYTTGISDYFVMTVDANDKVTYEEFRPGVGDSAGELVICEPSDWNSKRQGGWDATVGNSQVVTYDANGIPLYIKLFGVYHELNNYIGPGQTGNHMYTRDSDAYGDVMVLAASLPIDSNDSWASLGNGRFKDKLVWECAGITDYATAEFQQNANYPNKFRIAKPYPGTNSDEWFVFDVTDPDKVTCEKYYLDYEVTATGKGTFKPYIWTEYYTDAASTQYSKVLVTQTSGLPAVVELGPCYRLEPWVSYDYEIGRNHEVCAIEIIFPGCDPYINAKVTPYEYALKSEFHNPVAVLSLPNGTLDKLVVKIYGDLSAVTGLRLYQAGWMDNDYVAPDSEGVVTMTQFNNKSISGGIDLNFWITGSAVGASYRFEVLEAVVDGVSLPIVQDASVVHLGGIVVNTGGDKISVRGYQGIAEEVVQCFRIPALVTSNAGTLIAAYDIRYDNSVDLQRDIDVGVKRSTDGGKTWSDIILAMDMGTYGYSVTDENSWKEAQLNNGIGDPCLLVDENTGRLFCFAVWAHGHHYDSDNRCLFWAGKGFEIDDTPQFMMVYSDDDGITWSDPVNITRQIKKYDWRMTFQGPGRGITMKDGTLVIPIQHQEGEERIMHGTYPLNSGVAYSTDHGETWHAHNFAHTVTSESAVAEIEPGKLMLSMRDETDSQYRRVFTTTDLGRTWTEHSSNGKVYEQSACEASLIHVDAADNVLGQDLLLMSNPQGTTGWRSCITIQASLDKGATWTHRLLVDPGGSLGYSCLTMIDNATVGILYESSRGDIFFQAVPLTDIVK